MYVIINIKLSFAYNNKRYKVSSSGGIGRHKGLKIPRVKPYQFKSGLEDHKIKIEVT